MRSCVNWLRRAALTAAVAGAALASGQTGTGAGNGIPSSVDEAHGLDGAKKLMQQQLLWDMTAANGPKLVAKERSRVKGEQGTIVRYDLVTEGLPHDEHYELVTWSLNGPLQTVQTGISLTDNGRLICAGKTEADCKPSRPDADPVIDLSLTAAKGEPKRFGLISTDKKWKALTTVIAFPDLSTDKGCTLEVVRVTPQSEALMVRGKGFPSSAVLPVSSNSGGEIKSSTWNSDDKGEILSLVIPGVPGKTEGAATIQVKAPECSPKIDFPWGKGTYRPE